jgi:SAM-dependent methyltransferase
VRANPITGETVRDSFNDPGVVVHYTRAAHNLGLWTSERILIERWLPDRNVPLLEVGCGAGRVTLGLWDLGYRRLTAVDFAREPLEEARRLAARRGAAITFAVTDATRLREPGPFVDLIPPDGFAGVLFLFNGLMQIPHRSRRRVALRQFHAVGRPEALLLFTTHDRDDDPQHQAYWAAEADRWAHGTQDARLVEFGDRFFRDSHGGDTFMHLPTRPEVLDDLATTGWTPRFDAMRRSLAPESAAVREFSDECRFWVAQRDGASGP